MDLFAMLVWLIIIGGIVGVVACVVGNLKKVGDPTNYDNYWNENMYTYRVGLEEADRILEQGQWADARRAYQETIEANATNRVSHVLHDRLARAHHLEGLEQQKAGDHSGAMSTFRTALDAVGKVTALDAGVAARPRKSEFQSEITTIEMVVDSLCDSLVGEGVRRRDVDENPDAALSLLMEARERQPQHFRANAEIVQLHRENRRISPYLEAMRHVVDVLPAEDTRDFDAYARANPQYPSFRAGVIQNHGALQNYILQQYPASEWVPIVDGLTLHYLSSFFVAGGGESLGSGFDRTMRIVSQDPLTAEIIGSNGEPDITLAWRQVPGVGLCLTETWTGNLLESGGITWNLLPAQLSMGIEVPQPNGRVFTLVDVRADPEHGFTLHYDGWELGQFVITHGVGRTSNLPIDSFEGEYLHDVTYPGS
jgi:hypothetical protein